MVNLGNVCSMDGTKEAIIKACDTKGGPVWLYIIGGAALGLLMTIAEGCAYDRGAHDALDAEYHALEEIGAIVTDEN